MAKGDISRMLGVLKYNANPMHRTIDDAKRSMAQQALKVSYLNNSCLLIIVLSIVAQRVLIC